MNQMSDHDAVDTFQQTIARIARRLKEQEEREE